MEKTNYIVAFILILTASVAVLLTGLREVTKEKAAQNEDIFNKRALLSAVEDHLGDGVTVKSLSDQDVLDIFNKQVEQVVLNMDGEEVEGMMAEDVEMEKEKKKPESDRVLPLFIYNTGQEKFYILSVRGSGLWDEIWGAVALENDFNTVAGASFDHKGETPGLGAEIKDNPSFSANFKGKKIYDEGEYVSVTVRKGGARDQEHEVDGISGATVTADGVTEMLYRGIKYYQPYFKDLMQSKKVQGLLTQ
jgi:Na+-transporting NADH:ubiquinone oxidoreductase subunit C